MKPYRLISQVVSRREFGSATELVFRIPGGYQAEPGQFVHVLCGEESTRILRRPLSVYDCTDATLSLLVKKAGKGSAWLAGRREGDVVDMLGPLGRGFSVPEGGAYVLVAGGAGIAPLHFLGRRLLSLGGKAAILWGIERGVDYGELPGLLLAGMDARISSMDGSMGFQGDVLELFKACALEGCDGIYACGPKGMLIALAETIDRKKYPFIQVSLEERMACGVGACRGCAVEAAAPEGSYLMVCKDGPVFEIGEIAWKRISESTWQ